MTCPRLYTELIVKVELKYKAPILKSVQHRTVDSLSLCLLYGSLDNQKYSHLVSRLSLLFFYITHIVLVILIIFLPHVYTPHTVLLFLKLRFITLIEVILRNVLCYH